MTRRPPRLALLLILPFAMSVACRDDAPPPRASYGSPSAPRLAKATELTDAERRWGVGPRRGEDVTYQPDVVILDEGPEAVRGMSPNGLEWTLDRRASYAADVTPGKILFATSRVVGRVLAATTDGEHLKVILGPVELTDVLRKADIRIDRPIDFAEAIPFSVPEMPGVGVAPETGQARLGPGRTFEDGRVQPAVFRGASVSLIRARGAPAVTKVRSIPIVGSDGIGIRLVSDTSSLRFTGEGTFKLQKPEIHVRIAIDNGKLTQCYLELRGGAGIMLGFDAATDVGVSGNLEVIEPSLPTDFSIPIFGPSVPLVVNVRQGFYIDTGWGGKGTLKAKGEYGFEGGFRLGYDNGKFGLLGPSGFMPKIDPIRTIEGVSLGATGFVVAYQAKVIVGIGYAGFATGPYVRLHSSIGISRDSDLAALTQCRRSTFIMTLAGGFGYVIPRVVTNGINAFLRTLNVGEIQGEGGVQVASTTLLNKYSIIPPIAICGAEGK